MFKLSNLNTKVFGFALVLPLLGMVSAASAQETIRIYGATNTSQCTSGSPCGYVDPATGQYIGGTGTGVDKPRSEIRRVRSAADCAALGREIVPARYQQYMNFPASEFATFDDGGIEKSICRIFSNGGFRSDPFNGESPLDPNWTGWHQRMFQDTYLNFQRSPNYTKMPNTPPGFSSGGDVFVLYSHGANADCSFGLENNISVDSNGVPLGFFLYVNGSVGELQPSNVPVRVDLSCYVTIAGEFSDTYCTQNPHPSSADILRNFRQRSDEITVLMGSGGYNVLQSGVCTDRGNYSGQVFWYDTRPGENFGRGMIGQEPATLNYLYDYGTSGQYTFDNKNLRCNTNQILKRISFSGTRENPGNITILPSTGNQSFADLINGGASAQNTYQKKGTRFKEGWTAATPFGTTDPSGQFPNRAPHDCEIIPLSNFDGNSAVLEFNCRTGYTVPGGTTQLGNSRFVETFLIQP